MRLSDGEQRAKVVGRAAQLRPANRFESAHIEDDFEQLAGNDELVGERRVVKTVYLPDDSKTIIRENDSPDVPFRYSINAYRGCEHGCVYCYARPGHETLGFDAGLDFETRIMVKYDAAKLLRRELARPGWRGEFIAMSGVTDCYQPVERRLKLTRSCLEVMLEARQPVGMISKNVLMVRDLDVLAPMAEMRLVNVSLSMTTLDPELARTMEPRTATPAAKLRAIRELTAAGVPTRVMVAPVIPGLTDEELPRILEAAAEAGARSAGYILVRLPFAVRPIFQDWLARNFPLKKDRVEGLIRSTRGGRLNDPRWGSRMSGEGAYADQIEQTFNVFAKKYRLDGSLPPLDSSQFRRPSDDTGQMMLF
jgi:DNA repair photolyase